MGGGTGQSRLLSVQERADVHAFTSPGSGTRVSLASALPDELGLAERPAGLTAAWAAPAPTERPALGQRLAVVDGLALLAGWAAGWALAGRGGPSSGATDAATLVVGVVSSLAAFATLHLYRHPHSGVREGALGRIFLGLSAAAAVTVGWQSLRGDVDGGLVLASALAALLTTSLARYGFDVWLTTRRARGELRVPVVVAGAAPEAAALVGFLELNPEAGFQATAVVGDPPGLADDIETAPWLGGLDQAADAVRRTGAEGVMVAIAGVGSPALKQLVVSLSDAATPVYLSTGLTGVSGARLQSIPVGHEPISLVRPPHHSTLQAAGKRLLDVVSAAVLLVLTAPVMGVAAVLIKAHDRGPVLFRQVRIGRDGEPFTLLKLRTMEVDAEARLAELRHRNERHGPLFKVSADPRITPIGALLRSTAIDELPQLFNVLTGRMSIVGPRPALPAEMAEFDDELLRRHLVKPGVTGLWQVEANHKASFEEYRRLDLFYVDNWSVAMDLTVMIDTVPAIGRRGLRALRRPAPTAPAPASSPAATRRPAEVGP
jgi:exopolysaccharide biosynthesis polyprenyl glycosylphosphotransferase